PCVGCADASFPLKPYQPSHDQSTSPSSNNVFKRALIRARAIDHKRKNARAHRQKDRFVTDPTLLVDDGDDHAEDKKQLHRKKVEGGQTWPRWKANQRHPLNHAVKPRYPIARFRITKLNKA